MERLARPRHVGTQHTGDWTVANGMLVCGGKTRAGLSGNHVFGFRPAACKFRGPEKVNSGVFLGLRKKVSHMYRLTSADLGLPAAGFLTGSLVNYQKATAAGRSSTTREQLRHQGDGDRL